MSLINVTVKTMAKREKGKKSQAQINKIVRTFMRRSSKKVKEDIMLLAEEYDVKLSGRSEKYITQSKRKSKQVQNFYESLKAKYGPSYTAYMKKRRIRFNRYKKRAADQGILLDISSESEFNTFVDDMNDLYEEIFKYAYESKAISGTKARNIMDRADEMIARGERAAAMQYVKDEIGLIKADMDKDIDNPEEEDGEEYDIS